ncbi:MAG: hypothetical protein ABEJ97_05145 [Halobellus sp.]
MSNRVEELESKVAELQAAVNGLTEELVETKERVRLLEEEIEVDLAAGNRPVGHESQRAAEPDGEADESTADASTEAASATDAEGASEEAASGPLSESPAQAESRRETSAQTTDDADFIDADADDPIPSEVGPEGGADADAGSDENKADNAESEDEAATEDDDIIVA